MSGGSARITDSTFYGNRADGEGGAMWIGDSADVEMQDCTFLQNECQYGAGGAIFVEDGARVTVQSSSFEENYALTGGAAITVTDLSELFVYDTSFR